MNWFEWAERLKGYIKDFLRLFLKPHPAVEEKFMQQCKIGLHNISFQGLNRLYLMCEIVQKYNDLRVKERERQTDGQIDKQRERERNPMRKQNLNI